MSPEDYGVFEFIITLVVYVISAYVFSRVGAKFGIGSFAEFLIPVWNLILLLHCANMSGWHAIWYLIPLANLVITFIIWGRIAWRLGKNVPLWVLFLIVAPPVAMIVLAFDDSKPVRQQMFVYE